MLHLSAMRTPLLALLFHLPAFAGLVYCDNQPTYGLSGANVSLSCSQPGNNPLTPGDTSYASASFSTNGNVLSATAYAGDTILGGTGDAVAMVTFDVIETWTILGGTGTGVIYLRNPPPWIYESVQYGEESDDEVVAFGIDGSESPAFGTSYADTIHFTFGVPFTMNIPVEVDAGDGFGAGGYAAMTYDLTSGTYTIPYAGTGSKYWQYIPDLTGPNADLTSVTLIRSAVDPAPAPEPGTLVLAGIGLVLLGRRRGKEKESAKKVLTKTTYPS